MKIKSLVSLVLIMCNFGCTRQNEIEEKTIYKVEINNDLGSRIYELPKNSKIIHENGKTYIINENYKEK